MPNESLRPDPQRVEFLGRNRLIDELLQARLEVAVPIRDRGIDLVAYAELSASIGQFTAKPIQLKAAWERSFVIEGKYERIRNLVIAYVWNLGDPARVVTFAMTYDEGLKVGEAMGWLNSPSWATKKKYNTSSPSARLCELLEPYRMEPQKWWNLITRI